MNPSERTFYLLKRRGETVAFAESLTGGLIAATLIANPGSSAVIAESYVTYAEASKQRLLGVKSETLSTDGVVSAACAREMALGARRRSGADWAVSATGLAGPDGGTADKPVGTVFIGLSGKDRLEAFEFHFIGDAPETCEANSGSASPVRDATAIRASVRAQAVDAALTILADALAD